MVVLVAAVAWLTVAVWLTAAVLLLLGARVRQRLLLLLLSRRVSAMRWKRRSLRMRRHRREK